MAKTFFLWLSLTSLAAAVTATGQPAKSIANVPVARMESDSPGSRETTTRRATATVQRPSEDATKDERSAGGITLSSALLALSGGIVAALLGGALKYLYDLKIARRKDRLDRVNLQLRLLYGPLYATDLAAREAWLAFRKLCRPNVASFWRDAPPPTAAEAAEWRIWTTDVFMPLNERIEKTIVENADLLVGDSIPDGLLTMCAHVATYKAIRKKWETGDVSEHVSPIFYPAQEFRQHVHETFAALKKEQAALLAENRRLTSRSS